MISPVEIWIAERTGLGNRLSPESLSEWQREKLRNAVLYARTRTRFYRDLEYPSAGAAGLPFTTPADIAADPPAFLAIPPGDVARVTTLMTSGTTGIRKRIFFSESDLERTRNFFATGMKTLVTTGQHTLILISDDTENSLGSLLRSALSRIGVSADILYGMQDAEEVARAARGADCLVGMPAELLYLSRLHPDLRPGSILLTADYVPRCVVKSIADTWKCRVYTHYGLTEVGFGFAVDCDSHRGHHCRVADFFIEIIDPETGLPVKSGIPGEIVITSLASEAMPLIRYRTGDRSRLIDSRCGCGGMSPRLGRIEGRYENDIPVGGGQFISIHQLDELLFADPAVRSFRASLVQAVGKNRLLLSIDSKESVDRTGLTAGLPGNLEISVEYGRIDPFSCRGKRRIQTE